jgi:hypothetical protein
MQARVIMISADGQTIAWHTRTHQRYGTLDPIKANGSQSATRKLSSGNQTDVGVACRLPRKIR